MFRVFDEHVFPFIHIDATPTLGGEIPSVTPAEQIDPARLSRDLVLPTETGEKEARFLPRGPILGLTA